MKLADPGVGGKREQSGGERDTAIEIVHAPVSFRVETSAAKLNAKIESAKQAHCSH